MFRLVNVQNDILKHGGRVSGAIHFTPLEWLKQRLPYPSHLIKAPPLRPRYKLDARIQKKTARLAEGLDAVLAIRRRDRIEKITDFTPPSPSNCPTFIDYLAKYPIKFLETFFNAMRKSDYDSVTITPVYMEFDGM